MPGKTSYVRVACFMEKLLFHFYRLKFSRCCIILVKCTLNMLRLRFMESFVVGKPALWSFSQCAICINKVLMDTPKVLGLP